jgi:hypothetical protein
MSMRTVLVGNRGLMRYLLAAMLRADWDVVGILGAAGAPAALGFDLIVAPQIIQSVRHRTPRRSM